MKKTDPAGSAVLLFVLTECILYVFFLMLDLTSSSALLSTILKYCSILLCFFFGFIFGKAKDRILVISALGLTAAADAFLLVLDTNYTAGVLCFCGVQMLYYCRLLRAGVFLGILHIWNLLTAAGVFYFTQLLFNAAESLALRHISLPYRLFSAGLILFLCCDLCVGLSNLPSAAPFSVPEPVLSFAQNGMWLFYLPSQVLITLSILPDYSSCTSESS